MQPLPQRVRAVVFDLDGTLVDSSPDLTGALNTVLATNGAKPLAVEEVRQMVGYGAHRMVEQALAKSGVTVEHDVYPAFRAAYQARMTRESGPYPGVVRTLVALRRAGVRIAVCTNKPEDLARRMVLDLGLAVLLDGLIGGDSLPTKKPDPDMILTVLEQLEVAPEEALMVGDTQADIQGGANAGVATVGVPWGFGSIDGATVQVDSMAALEALVLERQ